MKLFCAVLVVYVVALTLFGVDGRGGGTKKGLEASMPLFARARRHVHVINNGLESVHGRVGNEEHPPPHFRPRRNTIKMNHEAEASHVTNEEPPPPSAHFRQRRQMPPPPEGMPPPPEGMPPPPEGMPPPPPPPSAPFV